MRKVGIIVIVCLLAVAGITAAMAYNTATVSNVASLGIINTSGALLSLNALDGKGNVDQTVREEDNVLLFEFGRGRGGQMFGLQPDSEYVWDKALKVVNNSAEAVSVKVEVTGDLKNYVDVGYVKSDTLTWWGPWGEYDYVWSCGSGSGLTFAFKVVIPEGTALADIEGNVIVSARPY